MDSELKGKIILITGAASGFGQAATRLLMQSGAMLALADINTQGLSAITREATAVGLTTAEFPLDVSSSEQVKTVVAAVVERFGRIDGMLHFAGVIDTHGIEVAYDGMEITL